MRRQFWLYLVMPVGLPTVLCAQGGPGTFNSPEQLGRRLFEQSCGVCHTSPTLTSPLFGPPLSKKTLNGNQDAMRDVISNGTPRMPAFKYYFQPDQIDAVVVYLGTLHAPAPEESTPAAPSPPRVQDN